MSTRPLNISSEVTGSASRLLDVNIFISGITRSGKSNTAGVIIEEIADVVPFTIIDIEGEMWGLKEQFDLLVVGRSLRADIDVDVHQAPALARFVWENRLNVILDVSGFEDEEEDERDDFLLAYLKTLWKAADADQKAGIARPYKIVVEECQEFIPEKASTPIQKWMTRTAKRGLKRGLGFILISQRPSDVSKKVISQCALRFLHRVIDHTDMAVYQKLLPWTINETKQVVGKLRQGEAVVRWFENVTVTQIRQRHTFHAGATPGLDQVRQRPLVPVEQTQAGMLDRLREALNASPKAIRPEPRQAVTSVTPRPTTFKARRTDPKIVALRDENARLLDEVERLRQQLAERTVVQEVVVPAISRQVETAQSRMSFSVGQVTVTTTTEPFRSPVQITKQTKRQEMNFKKLLDKVAALPSHLRAGALYLIDNPGTCLFLSELARATRYAEVTFEAKRPTPLVELGLLARDESKCYRSVAAAFLAEQFPDLNPDDLLAQLRAALE